MNWKDRALNILKESLTPIPHELSELDWKSHLSTKSDRLAQHICAFSNHQGGGMFAFGINDDVTFSPLSKNDIEEIVKKMGNIAHNNLSQAVDIDHAVLDYNGHHILFIYVPEQREKPIFLRGKDYHESYCRVGGQTRKMSELQVRNIIATSQGLNFEERVAKSNLTKNDVLQLLNFRKLFELLDKDTPKSADSIIRRMKEFGYCDGDDDNWNITNLGAILFANNLNDFDSLGSRKIVVRKYVSSNNKNILFEKFEQMFLLGFCERRDSGIDRAVAAIEQMHLPAAKIAKEEMCTRVTLYPHKEVKRMTKEEKIEACYQHAYLVNEDGKSTNNQSVRERFNLKKTQSSVASRIISDTLEAGLIKVANTDIVSKKFMTYVPYYV